MKNRRNHSIYVLFLISQFASQFIFAQNKAESSYLDLNGSWSFRIDPYQQGLENKWYEPQSSGDILWDKIDVPGNWDLRNEYAHYVGVAWYQTSFTIPQNWNRKNIKIHFEAVSHDATVWINGKYMGKNNSGFLPFEFDMTSLVQIGQPNYVTVQVDNSKKIGAIWNWGGIRRSVFLSASEGIRLTENHITPLFDYVEKSAEVHFRLKFQNLTDQNLDLLGEIRIKKDGVILKKIPFNQKIAESSTHEFFLKSSLNGNEVFPWHFDSPHLYNSEVIINGSEIPLTVERFGLRKVEVDQSKKQLLLNGETIRVMGFNLVPDDRITGNTLPLWRIKEDVDLMKSAGGNLARLSHLPLPKEVLDYLDERGMMTISEIPLWGFDPLADPKKEIAKEWLTRLIGTQYNHPSIIGWSVGNEIGHYPETFEYVKQSVEFTRTLDSTRLVTAVSHTAQNENDFLIHSDLGLINKYGSDLRAITEIQHRRFPGKVLFYSEYGISQFGEDLNSDFDAKSLINSLRGLPYLVGASLWTFNDYRSNYFGTKEFSENRSWGVEDVYRRKKRAFYSIRKELAPVQDLLAKSTTANSAEITLIPRSPFDLPAYTLRGYRLVWRVKDQNGKVLESGWENLPEITPGSTNLKRSISWETLEAQQLEALILTPQNDQVIEASIDFKSPKEISPLGVFGGRMLQNDIRPKSAQIRIFLSENRTSDFHIARIKIGEEVKQIGPNYENYIDINELEFSTPYELEVLAVNSKGETTVLKRTVEVDPKKVVPPAIRHIQREKNGFYVGYATEVDDFQFRVRYSKERNLGDKSKVITTTNPGLIFIPLEESNALRYFQIQRVKDNYYHSDWSPIYEIFSDHESNPEDPILNGVTIQNGIALIHFQPVKKALGYYLEYREAGTKDSSWKSVTISKSLAEFAFVEGLNLNSNYEFRLSSITSKGKLAGGLILNPTR